MIIIWETIILKTLPKKNILKTQKHIVYHFNRLRIERKHIIWNEMRSEKNDRVIYEK